MRNLAEIAPWPVTLSALFALIDIKQTQAHDYLVARRLNPPFTNPCPNSRPVTKLGVPNVIPLSARFQGRLSGRSRETNERSRSCVIMSAIPSEIRLGLPVPNFSAAR
jgi:hypothetical protein